MNSAALHSAKLIAEFEKQQQGEQEPVPRYPSEHPFGASKPGPFGGASALDKQSNNNIVAFASNNHLAHSGGDDAFTADNEMSNFAEWDASYAGAGAEAAAASSTTDMTTYNAQAGPSRTSANGGSHQPRALTQYDYPGGWGAQTFSGVGGLTQDSASRIATLQAKLNQRLGPEYLSQRPGPGGGKKLTYIEGWKLVDLANEVFGFNGWSTTIVRLDVDFLDCSPDGTRFNAGVSCVVRVTLRDGAFHEDIGYGSAENARQKHAALEKGKKEAVTDATKRALKNFGKLLGNCTYDHQYLANALKVSNPAPKFDASELHRRPELRAQMAPPPPQQTAPAAHAHAHGQQQNQPRPPPPPPPPQAQTPVQRSAQPVSASASVPTANGSNSLAIPPNGHAPVRPMAAPQQPQAQPPAPPVQTTSNHAYVGTRDSDTNSAQRPIAAAVATEDQSNVSERQQRSMLARQAYLERQQAEARSKPSTINGTDVSSSTATAAPTHPILTSANGQRSAADIGFGSDSFDDGLNDVLATYDETEMGDAEAASHALEMEIDRAAQRQRLSEEEEGRGDVSSSGGNYNSAADDSGVAFPESPAAMVLVKQENLNKKPLEMRRSTSPIKQVKSEAVKGPRRAGSVGRFVSPPPQVQRIPAPINGGAGVMRNGSSSLSAASNGWSAQSSNGFRRMGAGTLRGMGGVEGMAVSKEAAMAGRGVGESVQHGFVTADAMPRGVKRANGGVPSVVDGRAVQQRSVTINSGNNGLGRGS